MDIKDLLVQGFRRETYESKNGKLKYGYKSETVGNRLFANSQRESDRGIVKIAAGLDSFNDKKFDTFDKAITFVANMNQAIAIKVKKSQDQINLKVVEDIDEWSPSVKVSEFTDEEILTKLISGDRVVSVNSDKSIPFTVELQTLTVEEEIRSTEGFSPEDMESKETADNFKMAILRYGVKSINGIEFKDPLAMENAIKTLPFPMLDVIYNWHVQLSSRVRKALEDDENF